MSPHLRDQNSHHSATGELWGWNEQSVNSLTLKEPGRSKHSRKATTISLFQIDSIPSCQMIRWKQVPGTRPRTYSHPCVQCTLLIATLLLGIQAPAHCLVTLRPHGTGTTALVPGRAQPTDTQVKWAIFCAVPALVAGSTLTTLSSTKFNPRPAWPGRVSLLL